jgi:hypothetical protein
MALSKRLIRSTDRQVAASYRTSIMILVGIGSLHPGPSGGKSHKLDHGGPASPPRQQDKARR